MSLDSIYSNSLWWLQFHLVGGWRRQLGTVGIYVALVVTVTVLSFRIDPNAPAASVCKVWLMVLSVVQAAVVLLVGTSGVRRAVHRDFTTNMIESHRLTPMSSMTAAVGYLLGAPIQSLVVYGCGVAAGTVFCLVGGYSVPAWWGAMALLLWVAIVLWSVVEVLALSTSGAANLMMVGALLGITVGPVMVMAVPGLPFLLGASYWDLGGMGLSPELNELAPFVLGLQAAVLGTCLVGSARKYRRADIAAFAFPLGLLLVLEAAVAGAMGIQHQRSFPAMFRFDSPGVPLKLVVSMWASVMFGVIPLATAARQAAERSRHGAVHLAGLAVAVTGVAVGTYGLLMAGWFGTPAVAAGARMWGLTAVLVLLGLLGLGPYMWLWYRTRDKVLWPVLIYVFLFWVGPPVGDAIVASAGAVMERTPYTWISAVSPVGATLMLWEGAKAPVVPGMIVQGMIVSAWWGLVWRVSRRRGATTG